MSERRWNFSLRSMLIIVATLAIICWIALEMRPEPVTISLTDAVTHFNSLAEDDAIGRYQPTLTESEVLAAIQRQLPSLATNKRVHREYATVVQSRRLSESAMLHFMSRHTDASETSRRVWWINLDISFPDGTGYGLRIRENNSPATH